MTRDLRREVVGPPLEDERRIAILAVQAQVDEKVSASEVDPTMRELNDKLGDAAQAAGALVGGRRRRLEHAPGGCPWFV